MATKTTQPAPNKATPPKPTKPEDVEAIERADSEGMAQPQALPPQPVPADDEQRDPPNTGRDSPSRR